MKYTALTRRALIAGAALATAAAEESAEILRLPRKVRLGMIGFDGHAGEILDHLSHAPEVELVAYAVDGTDPAELASSRRNPAVRSARSYPEYGAMLEREKLDLAAVCNNDGRRAKAILACAAKGLHVISEKPLALNHEDLAAIRRAYPGTGPQLGCLLPMRFYPPYVALKQIVESGRIGEVLQITGQKSYQLGARPEWQRRRASYGSTVLWIAPHMIDLMRYCSGCDLVEVAGYQAHIGYPEIGDMENVTAAVYRLNNGGVATLHMDYLRPDAAPGHGDDRLRLAGTKGVAEYMESLGVVVAESRNKPYQVSPLPRQRSVFLEFLQSVYLGKPAALPPADIYRVNEITIATHNACGEHRFLKV